jgi:hypothetical protein
MFNFQARFAPLVESGAKTQTIRKTCRAKPGDTLYLYTGARTKACRKLGEGRCVSVVSVAIDDHGRTLVAGNIVAPMLFDPTCAENFAKADGFDSYADMVEWFRKQHGLPFSGYLYRWELRV